jgi:hypothetical protein
MGCAEMFYNSSARQVLVEVFICGYVHSKKRLSIVSSPAGMSQTKLSLAAL